MLTSTLDVREDEFLSRRKFFRTKRRRYIREGGWQVERMNAMEMLMHGIRQCLPQEKKNFSWREMKRLLLMPFNLSSPKSLWKESRHPSTCSPIPVTHRWWCNSLTTRVVSVDYLCISHRLDSQPLLDFDCNLTHSSESYQEVSLIKSNWFIPRLLSRRGEAKQE